MVETVQAWNQVVCPVKQKYAYIQQPAHHMQYVRSSCTKDLVAKPLVL